MTLRECTAVVKQLPETLNMKQGRLFYSELEDHMNSLRPYIVLDCSNLREMNRSAIYLLLCCLEEAMKRNGDVKLAAISAGARATLKLTGVDRIFEVFGTSAEAVNSFRQLQLEAVLPTYVPSNLHPASGNAT